MLKYRNVKMITINNWNKMICNTYGKPYVLQFQNTYRDNVAKYIYLPFKFDNPDGNLPKEIPEVTYGYHHGVQFKSWVNRNPNQLLPAPCNSKSETERFWLNDFCPSIDALANDLFNKGLMEPGVYCIEPPFRI